MPITDKTTASPPEQYYTTAPADYDWGWTTVLIENAATDDRGRKVRLVEISDGYHADFQTGRYGSGGHFSLTADQFRSQVKAGMLTETPEAEQVVSVTKDYDLDGVVDDPVRRKKVAIFFHFKAEPVDEVTVSFKPLSGGLTYRLRVHGPRVKANETFATIAAKIDAAVKGD